MKNEWKINRIASFDGKWIEWNGSNYENDWKVPTEKDMREIKRFLRKRKLKYIFFWIEIVIWVGMLIFILIQISKL